MFLYRSIYVYMQNKSNLPSILHAYVYVHTCVHIYLMCIYTYMCVCMHACVIYMYICVIYIRIYMCNIYIRR